MQSCSITLYTHREKIETRLCAVTAPYISRQGCSASWTCGKIQSADSDVRFVKISTLPETKFLVVKVSGICLKARGGVRIKIKAWVRFLMPAYRVLSAVHNSLLCCKKKRKNYAKQQKMQKKRNYATWSVFIAYSGHRIILIQCLHGPFL